MLTTTIAGRTWDFSKAIGRGGGQLTGFYMPTSAAVAPDGSLCVLSRYGDIVLSGIMSRSGQRVSRVGIEDDEVIDEFGQDDFVWSVALAIDSEGNTYISDEAQDQVIVFDTSGERTGDWGEAGTEEGKFNGPAGLAFDSQDNLYVVDGKGGRVQQFNKDGEYILGWGSQGSAEGQFDRPWGATVDREDNVYVADWGNDRVQKFSPDGQYLQTFGGRSNGAKLRAQTWDDLDFSGEVLGSLNHPADVAVDGDGDVYVTDWGNRRVQIYEPNGDFLTTLWGDAYEVTKWGQPIIDSNPDVAKAYRRLSDRQLISIGKFHRPTGIFVDDQDRIVITETNRQRVQIYRKLDGYMDPQASL